MTEEKEHFETIYSKDDYEFTFEADEEILNEMLNHVKTGSILDLGCGEGGDALFLAKKGFDVVAIDYSKTAISVLSKKADELNLSGLTPLQGSVESYEFEKDFDAIIGFGIFHFVEEKDAKDLINKAKAHTKKDGVNLFVVFREGDPSQEEDSEGYYFKDGELKELYSDWTILSYSEYEEYDEDQEWDNKLARILAKK